MTPCNDTPDQPDAADIDRLLDDGGQCTDRSDDQ
jgi:hypothetical protein